MSEIPEDIMSATRAVIDRMPDLTAMIDPSEFWDAVETQVSLAILAERERWGTEVHHLKAFRSFTISNTDIRDCPSCSGPRLGLYVCTHCGGDE